MFLLSFGVILCSAIALFIAWVSKPQRDYWREGYGFGALLFIGLWMLMESMR